jgi:hypothetical protein
VQNEAQNNGGAISFPPVGGSLPDATAVLTIKDSTFSQNVAWGAGGALWMQSQVKLPKALAIVGTAFHGNKVGAPEPAPRPTGRNSRAMICRPQPLPRPPRPPPRPWSTNAAPR